MLVFTEEKYLLSHFMKIACSSNPDMIMGWDIQGGSLGFLAEKALILMTCIIWHNLSLLNFKLYSNFIYFC